MADILQGKRIVLGVTGGVAAYKTAELIRLLTQRGVIVDVVMTEAATQFIGVVTLQALSGRPVFKDAWDHRIANNMAHIELSRGADAILIAPASADMIAKITHGHANDLLSTLCSARACPLILAPAMNKEMWQNPANQRNVAQLQEDGVTFFGPMSGDQACGEVGLGRMMEPTEQLDALCHFLSPKPLQGKRFLITAGPTVEPIDPVRLISNRSSGKMGYAIAQAAQRLGAQVTLVSGPTSLPSPYGVTRLSVQSASDMYDGVMAHVAQCDVFIGVAAVADWKVASPSMTKIKKQTGQIPTLEFTENPDILASVAALEKAPFCVGFAAETDELIAHAQAKRIRKNIPLLVGNIAQETFEQDTCLLTFFDEQGQHPLPAQSKEAAATYLVTDIINRLGWNNDE